MAELFVDTSGFYAVADASDRHHEAASSVFVERGSLGDLVTTDHVFVETWLLLRGRLGRNAAVRYWDSMMAGAVKVYGVLSRDVVRAREILGEWPDQELSLVDCTSFALMERAGIDQALACDRHFRIYRYGEHRKRSFEIVP